MRLPTIHKIESRVLLPTVAVVLAILLAGILALQLMLEKKFHHLLSKRVISMSDAVSFAAEAFGDPVDLQRFVLSMASEQDVQKIFVVHQSNGRIIAASRPDYIGQPITAEVIGAQSYELFQQASETGIHTDYDLQLIAEVQPVLSFGETSLERGLVYFEVSVASILDAYREIVQLLLLVMGAMVIGSVATVYFFTNRVVMRPIFSITDNLRSMRTGEQQALKLRGDDEISRLYNELDNLYHENRAQLVNLEENLALLHGIMDASNFAMMFIMPNGRIKMFSKGAELLLGYESSEITGIKTPLLFHPRSELEKKADFFSMLTGQHIAADFSLYAIQSSNQIPDEQEWVMIRKDGSTIPVLLSITRVTTEQGLLGYLAIAVDITEQKAIEQQLTQAKDDAVNAARVKSEFLANMSHEIRTPMNAIIGFARLLARDKQLNDKQKDRALRIYKASEHLLELLNDILDISKLEAGKLRIEKTSFKIDELLQTVADMFSRTCREKGLHFYIAQSDLHPDTAIGDITRIKQILVNLLSNAIKFTETGFVSLYLDWQLQGQQWSLTLSVCDSGIGVESDKAAKLFDAFEQADSSTTRKFGGTGLGLNICKQLAELMGGDIRMISQPGKGSTFICNIRLEAQEPAPKPMPLLQNHVVCLLDKDPVHLWWLTHYCQLRDAARVEMLSENSQPDIILASTSQMKSLEKWLAHQDISLHQPAIIWMDDRPDQEAGDEWEKHWPTTSIHLEIPLLETTLDRCLLQLESKRQAPRSQSAHSPQPGLGG